MHSRKTAYRKLPQNPTRKDLNLLFTTTPSDWQFADALTNRSGAKLVIVLHLKCMQYLGYFLPLQSIPGAIIDFVRAQGTFPRAPLMAELKRYEKSGTKSRHQEAIRKKVGCRAWRKSDERWLTEFAIEQAQHHHIREDLINCLLEELVCACVEFPALRTLEMCANKARKQVYDEIFDSIYAEISSEGKRRIHALFDLQHLDAETGWDKLKQAPKKPTNKQLKAFLAHVDGFLELRSILPIANINPDKAKHFMYEARAADASDMKRMRANKRYALAVIFIQYQHAKIMDYVGQLLERLWREIDNSAQQAYEAYVNENREQYDKMIARFHDVLINHQSHDAKLKRIDAIDKSVGGDVTALIETCEKLLGLANKNYLPFLASPYSNGKRSLLFNCLSVLDLRSTTSDRTSEQIIEFLVSLKHRKAPYVFQEEFDRYVGTGVSKSLIPERWKKLIIVSGDDPQESIVKYHRVNLEICLFEKLKQELSGMDLFAPYSFEYSDYREGMATDEELKEALPSLEEATGFPLSDAKKFTEHLKKLLLEKSKHVDELFPDNKSFSLVDGQLVVHKPSYPDRSNDLTDVEVELQKQLPTVSIVEAIADVIKWLKLDHHFSPLSGDRSRVKEPFLRTVVTFACYGLDLGPVQTAQTFTRYLTRKEVSWLNLKNATPEKLQIINEIIVNTYRKLTLPSYWGSGDRVAVDGTMWDLYEQNLMSEFHIRYGGYGGIGYYHVSDTYIALFSNFIRCGVYEGAYLLDGIVGNNSDIQPNTIHGDTHAQNYVAFSLSSLIGIKLMPRIRNIKDLNFYKADNRIKYKNIDAIFSDKIDFSIIERHIEDMARVAVSVLNGKILPSTILRRFNNHTRKNKLYFAFREMGKVMRTLYLLDFIADPELRRTVTAATNKNEQFNNFLQWIYFGKGGVIAENDEVEQLKAIKYNQIVGNMLTLYNVVKMEDVFSKLVTNGWEITPEILAGFSPYRQATFKRYGEYNVDFEKSLPPIEFERSIETHMTLGNANTINDFRPSI